jgi:hypothetical protein
MPAKSARQYRYMQMMAHNPEKSRKGIGPSEAVAKEFIAKTPRDKRKEFSRKK